MRGPDSDHRLARWSCATAALLLGAGLLASEASAHTSYLKPNFYKTSDATLVTAESSFTEDFPHAEVAVQSDQWSVVKPDGSKAAFKRVQAFEQMTVLEADLSAPGTYRLTTGERIGRVGSQIFMGGDWIPLELGQKIPDGVKSRPSQTATVADVYITKGAANAKAIEARTNRLELKPTTHPNAVTLKSGFSFRVLLDGKPVANQAVFIQRDGGSYETPKFDKTAKSDAQGNVVLSFDKPGAYLLMTRLSADGPAGSQTAIRSYTTSLTIEVAN